MNSIDDGLRVLITRGFRFQHVKDDRGNVAVIVGSYAWGEFYDRIQITGETEAIAARAVMDSRCSADGVVWSHEGDTLSAITALLELPKPDEPGAPRLVRRAPSGLWLPGTDHRPLSLPL
ncbi:hypothetical protein [Saccharopolyspora hattusasensis]|uniref:hypothetical protein n=1 Tax=Saccharopolyspora hattusasensis TaxID=1128679 RepID=UPI003D95C847